MERLLPKLSHPPRIGLALGGGGARGLAHIGVIQVFQQAGVHIDALSGTSMGALVAGLFARGMNFEEVNPVVNHLLGCAPGRPGFSGTLVKRVQGLLNTAHYLRHNLLGLGPESGVCFEEELDRLVMQSRIEDSSIPLAITATDIRSGELVILSEGPLARAMHASAALPGVFTPVSWGDKLLCDGGVISNVPVTTVRKLAADFVIAVDVGASLSKNPPKNGLGLLLHANLICAYNLKQNELETADFILNVKLSKNINILDFDKSEQIIQAGRETAEEALPKIIKLLSQEKKL